MSLLQLDEPNTTISNILSELKSKGITDEVTASHLKSGSGHQCILVLDRLTDLALLSIGFQWQRYASSVFELLIGHYFTTVYQT